MNIQELRESIAIALRALGTNTATAKTAKGEAVAIVRDIANKSHEAGLNYEQAGKLWKATAKLENVPTGTWKPYTKHVQGFVALIDSGKDIETGNDGKPYTQAQAVEAYKVATTPANVLAEMERISEAAKLFRLRIGGEPMEGFDWTRPDAGTVAELLEMLPAHPSETKDVTAEVVKPTKAQKERAEGAELLAELEAALSVQPAQSTGTEG